MTITTSGSVITFSDSTTQSTAATASIPAGSVVLFYQSAAPTGWTQVTSLNDYSLRLVSGTGGTTGGSVAFTTAFGTPSVSVGGLSAGATTLSTTQIPNHSHSYNYGTGGTQYSCAGATGSGTTGSAGGGGSHSHSISGSATATINVQYANVIICSKN